MADAILASVLLLRLFRSCFVFSSASRSSGGSGSPTSGHRIVIPSGDVGWVLVSVLWLIFFFSISPAFLVSSDMSWSMASVGRSKTAIITPCAFHHWAISGVIVLGGFSYDGSKFLGHAMDTLLAAIVSLTSAGSWSLRCLTVTWISLVGLFMRAGFSPTMNAALSTAAPSGKSRVTALETAWRPYCIACGDWGTRNHSRNEFIEWS